MTESCCEIAWFRSGNCSNLGIPAKNCDNRLYFSLPEKKNVWSLARKSHSNTFEKVKGDFNLHHSGSKCLEICVGNLVWKLHSNNIAKVGGVVYFCFDFTCGAQNFRRLIWDCKISVRNRRKKSHFLFFAFLSLKFQQLQQHWLVVLRFQLWPVINPCPARALTRVGGHCTVTEESLTWNCPMPRISRNLFYFLRQAK